MVKIIIVKFKGNSVAAYNFEITRQYTKFKLRTLMSYRLNDEDYYAITF